MIESSMYTSNSNKKKRKPVKTIIEDPKRKKKKEVEKKRKIPKKLTKSYLSYSTIGDSLLTQKLEEDDVLKIDSNTSTIQKIFLRWVKPLKTHIENEHFNLKMPKDLDVTRNERILDNYYQKFYETGVEKTLRNFNWERFQPLIPLVFFYKFLKFTSFYIFFYYISRLRNFKLDHKEELLTCFPILLIIEIFRKILRNYVQFQTEKLGLIIESSLSSLLLNKLLRKSIESDMRFEKTEFKFLLESTKKVFENFPKSSLDNTEFYFQVLMTLIFGILLLDFTVFFISFVGFLILSGFFTLIFRGLREYKLEEFGIEKVTRYKNVVNILKNIFYVKARGWDSKFEKKIDKQRNKELKIFGVVNTIENFWNFLYWIFTFLSIFIFFLLEYSEGKITNEKLINFGVNFDIFCQVIFSFFLLITQITFDTSNKPVIPNMKNFYNAIEFFFESDEVNKFRHKKTIYEKVNPINAVTLKEASLFWDVEDLETQKKKKTERDREEFLLNKTREREKKQKMYEIKMGEMQDFDEIIDKIERRSIGYTFNITAEGETQIFKLDDIKGESEYQLIDINLTIKKGDFCFILGKVDSGKSSLLKSIIGEMKLDVKIKPTFHYTGKLHYFDNNPWILDGSLKENIILNKTFIEERFEKALKWSMLEGFFEDIQDFDKVNCNEFVSFDPLFKLKIECARAIYSK